MVRPDLAVTVGFFGVHPASRAGHRCIILSAQDR